MNETDPVEWLRAQIEGDLSAARIIGAGGFEPQRWDTEPPGQVNPDDIPASDQINAVLVPDAEDGEFREWLPGWVQVVTYDRLNTEPPERDSRDDDLPVMLVQSGRRQFEHIIRNDPRNVVARCEAELAILDEHELKDWGGYGESCRTCCDWLRDGLPHTVAYPCRTVALLLGAYKHREGYDQKWTG